MSTNLRKLTKKRNNYKASINQINDFVKAYNSTIQSTRQVSTRLSKLNDLMDSFAKVQEDIIELDEGEDDDDEYLKYQDIYCTVKANMEDIIAKHGVPEAAASTNLSRSSVCDSIRLPTIKPPEFNGSLEDWASFIDTFNALFHNNSSLSDVQRLHYLKTSVSGPAADIIKNFTITAENYTAAYNELVRQYENKSLTIQSHIRSLLQTPKVQVPSAVELRNLHHHISSHVRALKALGQPVMNWDAWLVTLICSQLDSITAGEWQLRQDEKELPTYAQIESFLSKRVAAYEAGLISNKATEEKVVRPKHTQYNNKALFSQSSEGKHKKCPACSGQHNIYSCEHFKDMSIADRRNFVSKARLCFNCLNYGHQVKDCKFSACPKCNKRHNSKLHEEQGVVVSLANQLNQSTNSEANAVLCAELTKPTSSMHVMLATASVYVHDINGRPRLCRAVLDSGSQLNLVTLACVKRLGFSSSRSTCNIVGVGEMASKSQCLPLTYLSSRFGSHKRSILLHSLPTIVNSLPAQTIDTDDLNIPEHIRDQLADPQFNVPGPIDILVGTEMFFDILGGEKWPLTVASSLHSTDFGWIVVGKLPITSRQTEYQSLSLTGTSSLSLFTVTSSQPAAEEQAERHFASTVSRDINGRFIVKLPFAQDPHVLGDSRQMAQRRFFNLEQRFSKEPDLAQKYKTFMAEYLSMDHMEVVDPAYSGPVYYLPHHAVLKAESLTTKLRVVFDGSAVSKSGLSLNDILLKGPKTQPDLINILLRFRVHRIAVTADIEKMYRQIRLSSEDCELQRICYRANPNDQITEYKLKTVTYGTRSASFLSTRCLAQIAHETTDLSIKRIISQDFYVDDLISGGDSIEVVTGIYHQLQHTLAQYGLPLRKWCSSSSQFVDHIPRDQSDTNFVISMIDTDTVATLGLLWQPATDNFLFNVEDWYPPPRMTKRSLLSDINSVFDPVGLVSPVLIKGKIFIQQLWALKISWDEVLSEDLQNRWTKFYSSLRQLNLIAVPRRVIAEDTSNIKLHVFSDASQEAYGACAYICSQTSSGSSEARLYMSKSRVAPMKSTTIPRLELNGALLAAELARDICEELKLLNIEVAHHSVFLWSDSAIVIAWIKSKCNFQPYVSNRIARIQDISDPNQWHHVPTRENPADIVSRGMDAAAISQSMLWWHGPQWLQQEPASWPSSYQAPEELPEVRPVKLILATASKDDSWILGRYSKYMQLIRITALIMRFVKNCKLSKRQCERITGSLSVHELNVSREFWIRNIQAAAYCSELKNLKSNLPVHRSSCLVKLNPFIDPNGILRVGGRLANAPIKYDTKFPIVLPPSSTFTQLLFKYEHLRLLHVGPQALLSYIQINYWPIRGRNIATRTVHQCIQCFRAKPGSITPFMAPLPRQRTTIERPFSRCGVDFCGPMMIRSGIRRVKSVKAYISVFVCLVTRAVHLELVSSLTSDAFLATLTRFMSRRGQCKHLFSDNGTNFVGANRKLLAQIQEIAKTHATSVFLTEKSIQWHFIPPAAPHFGGLWEAAVKSAKQHLTKISINATFTYEEATTLLCGIEGVLNSRPMTPLSNDPSDLQALTPAHFLIGGVITLPPESDVSTIPMSRLKRFKMVQSYMQQFWKRWSREYLPQLQRRGRWIKVTRNVRVGDLCLLHQENLPPTKWALVRVQEVHPGPDGTVRVVTLRNSSGTTFQRPVVKLSLLPTEEDETEILPEPIQ
ncbi:uncharacterized protein LOC114118967 [Aphis gossypii]|uniref:uncharacterized protein LOC114118967 n=1 Tax=Aphis gossypii TaxID=80765 RepID=UPI0021599CF8|nr:uncharacterized protein LOC114118967 [Aphis gossypii]